MLRTVLSEVLEIVLGSVARYGAFPPDLRIFASDGEFPFGFGEFWLGFWEILARIEISI